MFQRIENIAGNGEDAGDQHLLFFSQYFQKAFSSGALKVVFVWYNINPVPNNIFFTKTDFKNILRKGKNVRHQSLSLSLSLPLYLSPSPSLLNVQFLEAHQHIKYVVCKYFQLGTVNNFVVLIKSKHTLLVY